MMHDMHGKDLCKGDRILVYQRRYQRKLIGSGIWEVDQTKPLPGPDVPQARGVVEWDEYLLSWVMRYEWTCDEWDGKAGALMGGGEYAYEKI